MNNAPRPGFSLSYTPALDGIRGVSILAVMIYHAGASFVPGGFIGVDVFFVLSGFLITALLLKEYDRSQEVQLKKFYIRRALRLAPALGVLLLVFSVSSWMLLEPKQAASHLWDALITLCYASNWTQALDIHPPDLLGHTWSLSIEEQFYILWPIMLCLLLRRVQRRETLCGIVFGLALAAAGLRAGLALNGVGFERLYYGLDARADSLLVGCALGIALSSNLMSGNRQLFLSRQLKWMSPLSALALLAIAASFGWTSPAMYRWAFFAVAVFAGILILDVFFAQTLLVKKVFCNKVLIWIGKLSYGLYLWHYPIYRTMRSQGYDPMAIFWLGTLLTFCVATASYYLVERRILALKQRFEGHPQMAAGHAPIRGRFRVESVDMHQIRRNCSSAR